MSKIQLFQGDCLEVMKEIPDKSVDMVLTDPPYCIGTTSNGTRGNYLDNNLIKPFFDILFSEYKRVCKETASIYINTDWRTYPFLYPILQKDFDVRNLIVWDYEWIKAGAHYRFSYEFIIYCIMPKCKRAFSASERDVWRIKPINYTNKNKLHNAQKPVALCEKAILNSTEKGMTVLDTFLGSGATGVACVKNDRNFIGIELDENYFQIAKERIKKAGVENGQP